MIGTMNRKASKASAQRRIQNPARTSTSRLEAGDAGWETGGEYDGMKAEPPDEGMAAGIAAAAKAKPASATGAANGIADGIADGESAGTGGAVNEGNGAGAEGAGGSGGGGEFFLRSAR